MQILNLNSDTCRSQHIQKMFTAALNYLITTQHYTITM